jgi:fucose permease
MNRRQLALGFLGYVCIGTAVVLLPSLMPSITREFLAQGWSLAAIGLLVPAGAAGGIAGTLLAGVGSDMLGHRRLIASAAFTLALALALAAATPPIVFALCFVAAGVAQGALSTGINAMIADAGRAARGRVLNLLHGMYGLGAAASPLVIGFVLERGVAWRWALGGIGALWLGYAVLVWTLARSAYAQATPAQPKQLRWAMLREPPFLALFLIAFIYNGVAVSLLSWIAVFGEQSAGLPAYLAISMVSVFYVALTAGRFICALVAERMSYTMTLFVLVCVVALAYPFVVFGFHAALVVLGVFFTGLGFSGLFPTALADGTRRYPSQTGTVTGTLSVALTVGSLIPPVWTSFLVDQFDMRVALGVNYGMIVMLVVLVRYLGAQNPERRAQSGEQEVFS